MTWAKDYVLLSLISFSKDIWNIMKLIISFETTREEYSAVEVVLSCAEGEIKSHTV